MFDRQASKEGERQTGGEERGVCGSQYKYSLADLVADCLLAAQRVLAVDSRVYSAIVLPFRVGGVAVGVRIESQSLAGTVVFGVLLVWAVSVPPVQLRLP